MTTPTDHPPTTARDRAVAALIELVEWWDDYLPPDDGTSPLGTLQERIESALAPFVIVADRAEADENEPLIRDPLGDGGRFYGSHVPRHPDEKGIVETSSDDGNLRGVIAHYERQGRKITQAHMNRIEHPDGTHGYGVAVHYILTGPAEDGEPGGGEEGDRT